MNRLNPITKLDYPDLDVIRVGNTFYMVSTTMYFMPGCEILRSFNLVNWEHAAYVYDRLDSTPAQKLEGRENIYGQGMWAASLRYHDGMFYICFVANDTHKTYVYQSDNIDGPWVKYNLDGFYHDNSILFDDDGKVYIVYGNKDIYIRELELLDENGVMKLSDKKSSSTEKLIISDGDDAYLGYEGAHFYRINGRYYIFLIHIPKKTAIRTESCFVSDSPFGPYRGADVMDDTRDYRGSGVAQGGIVDTPDDRWYSILFQDSGAVGRIPVLMPVYWDESGRNSIPVFGDEGRIPAIFEIPDLNPGYVYCPLVSGDDFRNDPSDRMSDSFGFKSFWQFNHEPDLSLVKRDFERGTVTITTDKLCDNLTQAKNTLTQRTLFPGCKCSVTVDGSGLKEGDFAGLCILESCYGFVGITKEGPGFYLVAGRRIISEGGIWGERHDTKPFEELERVRLEDSVVTLGLAVTFDRKSLLACGADSIRQEGISFPEEDDTARLGYGVENGGFVRIGTDIKLEYKLDHFTGARFGLFVYSTKQPGGRAAFSEFVYYEK